MDNLKVLENLLIEIELYVTTNIRLSVSEDDYKALKWAIQELKNNV